MLFAINVSSRSYSDTSTCTHQYVLPVPAQHHLVLGLVAENLSKLVLGDQSPPRHPLRVARLLLLKGKTFPLVHAPTCGTLDAVARDDDVALCRLAVRKLERDAVRVWFVRLDAVVKVGNVFWDS